MRVGRRQHHVVRPEPGDALPKRGFVLQGRHSISIEVLEPISSSEVEKTEPEEMLKHVRDRIAQSLKIDAAD